MSKAREWAPEQTLFFGAGLTEWASDRFPAFSNKDSRRDTLFAESLATRGVPQERIRFLQDTEATKARMESELVAHLAQSKTGDQLLFFFSGHGTQDEEGQAYLAPHDAGDEDESLWSAASIFALINEHFRGDSVILLLDSCYSGGFAEALRSSQALQVPHACLSASAAGQTTTLGTYFAEALIDGFSGRAWVDEDGDGSVLLGELAEHIADELAFSVGQLCTFHASDEAILKMRLATGGRRRAAEIGRHVEARSQFGSWGKARIQDVRDGKFLVHFNLGGDDSDEWVGPARIRPYSPQLLEVGTKVTAMNDDKEWRPAVIVAQSRGVYQVKFASGLEWCSRDQIRLAGESIPEDGQFKSQSELAAFEAAVRAAAGQLGAEIEARTNGYRVFNSEIDVTVSLEGPSVELWAPGPSCPETFDPVQALGRTFRHASAFVKEYGDGWDFSAGALLPAKGLLASDLALAISEVSDLSKADPEHESLAAEAAAKASLRSLVPAVAGELGASAIDDQDSYYWVTIGDSFILVEVDKGRIGIKTTGASCEDSFDPQSALGDRTFEHAQVSTETDEEKKTWVKVSASLAADGLTAETLAAALREVCTLHGIEPGKTLDESEAEADSEEEDEAASAEQTEQFRGLALKAADKLKATVEDKEDYFWLTVDEALVMVTLDEGSIQLWASGYSCEADFNERKALGKRKLSHAKLKVKTEEGKSSLEITAALPFEGLSVGELAAAVREVAEMSNTDFSA